MKTISYLVILCVFLFGVSKNIPWVSDTGLTCLAIAGIWEFISGRNRLSDDEKKYLREHGDVGGGES